MQWKPVRGKVMWCRRPAAGLEPKSCALRDPCYGGEGPEWSSPVVQDTPSLGATTLHQSLKKWEMSVRMATIAVHGFFHFA